MRSKVFSQLDTRWSKLPYPVKPYNLGTSGCGCCSVTHVIIERDKYKNYTPKNVQPYMKQFAVSGKGTSWAGITKALEHYGFKVINHPTMKSIFETLNKRSVRLGVILFRGGTKGGITWTTNGHFVAFTNYKYDSKTKKHWFYCKDSGGRKHTGWYCYETQMKGLIPQIWSALPPAETKTTKKKTTVTPKPSVNGKKIASMATKLAYKNAPAQSKYPAGRPTTSFQTALDKVYPNRGSWSKAPRKGASCDVFVGTVVRASGVDAKYPRGLASQKTYLPKSKLFTEVKNPTVKTLLDGDILVYLKTNGKGHTCIYVDGKIKEASLKTCYGRTSDAVKSRMSMKDKRWLKVYRAK